MGQHGTLRLCSPHSR